MPPEHQVVLLGALVGVLFGLALVISVVLINTRRGRDVGIL